MQIEVVDDCSTKDDPEAVVRELGHGRILFYRLPKNGGAIANFNTCIQRSRGHFIHILHGDDCVLPGFYDRITAVTEQFPSCALYASRCFTIDEAGQYTGVMDRTRDWEEPSRSAEPCFRGNRLQCAGVVVRRSFYELTGGFLPQLVHTADWEMWARAFAQQGGVMTPDVLALYRVFAGNDTGRLRRSAENLVDEERLALLLATRHPEFNLPDSQLNLFLRSFGQEFFFLSLGDTEAAIANRAFRRTRRTWGNLRHRVIHHLRKLTRRGTKR